MTRTTTLVMVLGLALGIGCKKQNDTSANEAPKTQETAGAQKPASTPAAPAAAESASASTQASVNAGGIEHPAEEGAAAIVVAATGTVEVERVGEPTWSAA